MAITYVTRQLSLAPSFNIISSVSSVIDWCRTKKQVQFDIETTGLNFKKDSILLYQFGDWDTQFVINNHEFPIMFFKSILEDENILKIGHNLGFEYRFCREAGITMECVFDTMLAEKCLYQGLKLWGYGLDDVVTRYLNIDVSKTTRASFIGHKPGTPFDTAQIEYAAFDVKPLEKVMELQLKDGEKKGVVKTIKQENAALLPLSDIEYNGLGVDIKSWRVNATKNEEELLKMELDLDEELIQINPSYAKCLFYATRRGKDILTNQYPLFGEAVLERKTDVNWSSAPQKLKILKDELGITIEKKGKATVDIKLLAQIKNPPVLVKKLIKYGEKAKEISSYGHSFIDNYITRNFKDNRVRTSFSQIQDTGRTSSGNSDSRNKKKDNWFPSPNTQNIPQGYRKYFIADEGWKFIGCDYTAQEPIVLADKCQDPILLEFYRNGDGDLYSLTASKMYSIMKGEHVEVPSKIEDDPIKMAIYDNHPNKGLRQKGKTMVLKLNYGGAAYTVKDDLGVSEAEAEMFVNAVLQAFPVKTAYQEKIKEFGLKHGYILINDVTGRKTWFYNWPEYKRLSNIKYCNRAEFSRLKKIESEIQRQCCNYPIQGTSADITKLALHFIRQAIKKGGYRDVMKLVNMIHDEVIMECKDEFLDKGAALMEECMIKAGKVFIKSLELKAKPTITQYWTK